MTVGRVQDKVALITGAARGQGAEHAKALASEGANVVLTDVLDDDGEAVAKEIRERGGRARYQRLDVRDSQVWSKVVSRVVDDLGSIDVLVNNAGIVTYAQVTECTDEEWSRTIAVNQSGVFYGMRAVIPWMRKSGGGSIVNVSSVYGGIVGVDGYVAYGSTKAAVYFMTKSAAITYGPHGIRVNAIAPGALDTPMLREEMKYLGIEPEAAVAGAPIARLAHASETSPAVVYLASDESSYVTGILLPVDGGLTVGTA
jgi:3alpha(or 20beta)-hydroxysteroid dehydrogenase